MLIVVSSKAIPEIERNNSGISSVKTATIAYEKRDYNTAFHNLTTSAKKGDMVAQFKLAKMYREGEGVPKNYAAALKWFNLSAKQGNAAAQYHLGVAYSFGLGVVPNYEVALRWYTRSAKQGNSSAQYHLSLLYYFGNGVEEDKAYAFMWSNIASTNGFEMAEQLSQVLTEQMTPSQIDEALLLARLCKDSNLTNC